MKRKTPPKKVEAPSTGKKRYLLLVVPFALVIGAFWFSQSTLDVPEIVSVPPALEKAEVKTNRGFVTSNACKECHPKEHASWHKTYHRTMTQTASTESVVAPFDDVHLESRGRSYRLHRQGKDFFVSMVDPEYEAVQSANGVDVTKISNVPMVTRQVVMTTGSHHMQGYWFPRGVGAELLQVPFYYHVEEKRWIPREDVFLRPHERDAQLSNWSMVCVKCHCVGGIPGGLPTQPGMQTTMAEMGIACESCHGPGERHVEAERAAKARGLQRTAAERKDIVNPTSGSAKMQSQVCGQCHSEFVPVDPIRFWSEGLPYRAGQDLAKSHRVVALDDDVYKTFGDKFIHSFWNDGTCRVGGDEYNAHVKSPCFERGDLSCLSCHSLHQADPNDLLKEKMDGNLACQQCHTAPKFNAEIESHTHHKAETSGSLCYNCHMPYTSYALMTALRSHRITNPKVSPIAGNGMPNACNLCHLDQTLQWTSERLSEWYGTKSAVLNDDERSTAASVLWLLKGDALQRALAAWHLGWEPATSVSGTGWQAPFLATLLDDPYAGVRYQSIRSLRTLPDFRELECDFIGSSDDRHAQRTAIEGQWNASASTKSLRPNDRVLIKDGGQLDRPMLQRLLRQRDDTKLTIPE